ARGAPGVCACVYLMTSSSCLPVSRGVPPQLAENFTGRVLFSFRTRSGLTKLPPDASAPPKGGRNPSNARGARDTVKVQLASTPLEFLAVAVTVVVPTGKPEPGGIE